MDTGMLRRIPAVKGIQLDGFGRPPLFKGRARDTTWAGRAGCVLSHREAIAYAASQGWRSVLIFEDDIRLADGFGKISGILPEILAHEAWDICYLGYSDPVGPFREVAKLGLSHSLYEIYGCNTTHAYLVRNTAYDALLEQLPTRDTIWAWLAGNRAIDRWYMRSFSSGRRILAVSPSIVDQKQGASDITGRNQEFAHVTEVSRENVTRLPYGLARGLRRFRFMLANAYDALRGHIKRARGF
jgi:hypothetical protein